VSELSGTADAREGLAAVIERRKPSVTAPAPIDAVIACILAL
jgi:hypothetical protein